MTSISTGKSESLSAAPAPEQRAFSRTVVSHLNLDVSFHIKHKEPLLRIAVFQICCSLRIKLNLGIRVKIYAC